MRMRFAGPGVLRRLGLLAIFIVAALACRPGFGQTPTPSELAAIESARATLDHVESALGEHASAAELTNHRAAITTARDALGRALERIEPRLAEAQERLKQLGPAPAKDAPPEAAGLTAERAQMSQILGELDAAAKQSRLLLVRSDQLVDRIATRRSALSARQILTRGPSVLDPALWFDVAAAVSDEAAQLRAIGRSWAATAGEWTRLVAAVLCLGVLLFAARSVRRWWRRRYVNGSATGTRFAKARRGLWVFASGTILAPVVTWVALSIIDLLGLWPPEFGDLTIGVFAGVMAAAVGRAAARGVLAPERPTRRLIAVRDETAACLSQHIVWSTRTLGVTIVLQVLHRSLAAQPVVIVATSALFALVMVGLLVHLILRLRRIEETPGQELAGTVPWVRPVGWVIVATLIVSLAAGYASLAGFIAFRTIVAVVLGCALYLWLVAADALFTEALNADTPRGRALAANLGVTPRNAGLLGTLLSAAFRIVLTVVVLAVIIGPWEASTADLLHSVGSVPLGFRIGEITISFRGLLNGLLVLLVTLALTRIAQRWLQARFLPLTTLEPSLQLSIATIFGYVGVITGIALALGALGIDLQKIAIVAGALSVGIGFGLQSIVSNFVSGLILLAERPIRVGDSIAVKGEEGWVRRIRVRATEIETFDRASVIIPNSELITGLVKNWTHANTMSRVIVKASVSYDSDPEQVRDLLEQAAKDHPQVVKSPPPRAFLLGFGDHSLDFELRCVIANVEQGLSVRSDLHIAVLRRLRETGVEIPAPPLAARPPPPAAAASGAT